MELPYNTPSQDEVLADHSLDFAERIELFKSQQSTDTGQCDSGFAEVETELGGTYIIARTYKEAQEKLSNLQNSSLRSGVEAQGENFSGARNSPTSLFDSQGRYDESVLACVDEPVVAERPEGHASHVLKEQDYKVLKELSCKRNKPKTSVIESRVGDICFTDPIKARQLSQDAGLSPFPSSVIFKEIKDTVYNKYEADALQCTSLKNDGLQSHVPELFAVGASNGYVLLVEEKVKGRQLSKVIEESSVKPLTQPALLNIAEAMVKSLHALDEANIAHLDIKPENAILRCNVPNETMLNETDNDSADPVDLEKPVTLCHIDFGFAIGRSEPEFHNPTRAQLRGTPQYMSPQMVKNIKLWYESEDSKQEKLSDARAQANWRCDSASERENLNQVNSLNESLFNNVHAPVTPHPVAVGNPNFYSQPTVESSADGSNSSTTSKPNLFYGETNPTPVVGAKQDYCGSSFHPANKTVRKTLRNFARPDDKLLALRHLADIGDTDHAFPQAENQLHQLSKTFGFEKHQEPHMKLERSIDYQSAALLLYEVANGQPFFVIKNAKTFRERVFQRFDLENLRDGDIGNGAFVSKLDELDSDESQRERFPKWLVKILKCMYIGELALIRKYLDEAKKLVAHSQKVVHHMSHHEAVESCLSSKPIDAPQHGSIDQNSFGKPMHQFQLCETGPCD